MHGPFDVVLFVLFFVLGFGSLFSPWLRFRSRQSEELERHAALGHRFNASHSPRVIR